MRPAPTSPKRPTISPAAGGEVDPGEVVAVGEALDAQPHGVGEGGVRAVGEGGRAADHVDDEVGLGQRLRRLVDDEPPVAEHEDAVAMRERLLEAVGDEDEADALGCELVRQREEPLAFAGGERGGGLVEDEEARLLGDRLGELDELLLAAPEAAERGARVDVAEADAGEHATGGHVQATEADEAAAVGPVAAEEDVLGDAERAGGGELLVDEADAEVLAFAHRGERGGAAVEGDLAGRGREGAGDDVDQRRLAGAVLADEADDLARRDAEVDAVQHGHVAEALRRFRGSRGSGVIRSPEMRRGPEGPRRGWFSSSGRRG